MKDLMSIWLFFRSNKRKMSYHIKDCMSVCYNQLAKLDFQIGKTESAIAFSTQSKKKFEYNARLKEYKEEREKLIKEK